MNPNQKQQNALINSIEYEQTYDPAKFSLGWSWSDVRVPPATLNNLFLKGLIEEKFHSNNYRGLLLTELGHEQVKQLLGPTEIYDKAQDKTLPLPDDMFEDIIGHDEIKELLRAVLLAEKPVHVLLAGHGHINTSVAGRQRVGRWCTKSLSCCSTAHSDVLCPLWITS